MSIFRLKLGSASSSKTSLSIKSIKEVVDYGPITNTPIFTPPKDYEPIFPPPINHEQQEKVKQLMVYADTIILKKDDPYYPNERGFLSEGTANRYLRARKWDLEAAKTMLNNSVNWRREYRPDQINPESIRSEVEAGKMYFSGYDKAGRPLWIMKPRYENSSDGDLHIKHIIFCLERGIRLMPDHVEKISIVVDFKNSTSGNNPSVGTCKKFLDILGNHYPERLGTAFLVKSPWFFIATFKLIAPFMDPITRNKIKFINPDDTKECTNDLVNLKDHIPLDHFEVDLGGSFNFEYKANVYWSKLLERTGNPCNIIEYK
ncbi:CRAL-TRIO domain-containing protein [Pilobolus umbonatus]|nr:CRAL-TRIO domain-containing protein [Pilobolus umbonatus]